MQAEGQRPTGRVADHGDVEGAVGLLGARGGSARAAGEVRLAASGVAGRHRCSPAPRARRSRPGRWVRRRRRNPPAPSWAVRRWPPRRSRPSGGNAGQEPGTGNCRWGARNGRSTKRADRAAKPSSRRTGGRRGPDVETRAIGRQPDEDRPVPQVEPVGHQPEPSQHGVASVCRRGPGTSVAAVATGRRRRSRGARRGRARARARRRRGRARRRPPSPTTPVPARSRARPRPPRGNRPVRSARASGGAERGAPGPGCRCRSAPGRRRRPTAPSGSPTPRRRPARAGERPEVAGRGAATGTHSTGGQSRYHCSSTASDQVWRSGDGAPNDVEVAAVGDDEVPVGDVAERGEGVAPHRRRVASPPTPRRRARRRRPRAAPAAAGGAGGPRTTPGRSGPAASSSAHSRAVIRKPERTRNRSTPRAPPPKPIPPWKPQDARARPRPAARRAPARARRPTSLLHPTPCHRGDMLRGAPSVDPGSATRPPLRSPPA